MAVRMIPSSRRVAGAPFTLRRRRVKPRERMPTRAGGVAMALIVLRRRAVRASGGVAAGRREHSECAGVAKQVKGLVCG